MYVACLSRGGLVQELTIKICSLRKNHQLCSSQNVIPHNNVDPPFIPFEALYQIRLGIIQNSCGPRSLFAQCAITWRQRSLS